MTNKDHPWQGDGAIENVYQHPKSREAEIGASEGNTSIAKVLNILILKQIISACNE